jgi:hypothetical protein
LRGKARIFGIGNLYSRIPGLSVLSGGVEAHQRKETKMTARTPKVAVFKGELTKAAVIFFCFFSLPGRTAPSFLEATAKTTCPPRQVIWRRVAHQTRLGVAGLPPPHAPGVPRARGGSGGSGAHGKRRSRSKMRCKASGMSTLVHGSQVTRLSHAGHASFTRWAVKRRRMANEARATITDGGPRHTVRLG